MRTQIYGNLPTLLSTFLPEKKQKFNEFLVCRKYFKPMQLYYIITKNIVTSTCINEIEKKKSLFTSYMLL
jgi:hypothetical protein